MRKLISHIQFTTATMSLMVMNLIPLVGVFWFGWDAGTIVFLYWLENIVIGLLNIPKMFACQGESHSARRAPKKGIIFLSVFFALHYGGFCLGHYFFLKSTYRSLPGLGEFIPVLLDPVLFWSLLGLTLSHIISMIVNFYGKREYETRSPNKQMFIPYSRIMLLHIVIILSGFVALATGEGVAILLLLVLFKIAFDLAAHIVEHTKAENITTSSSVD